MENKPTTPDPTLMAIAEDLDKKLYLILCHLKAISKQSDRGSLSLIKIGEEASARFQEFKKGNGV